MNFHIFLGKEDKQMKNRKLAIVAFFLAAVMCIGAGYAVLTDILDIQGVANVSATEAEKVFESKIYFTSAVANETGNTAEITQNNDKATFTANTLAGQGNEATFTFTIKNANTDLDANVTPKISANTNPDYFKVSSDWNGATTLIKAGEEKSYTVTVKLLETPTETIGTSIAIELTAVSVEPTENV